MVFTRIKISRGEYFPTGFVAGLLKEKELLTEL